MIGHALTNNFVYQIYQYIFMVKLMKQLVKKKSKFSKFTCTFLFLFSNNSFSRKTFMCYIGRLIFLRILCDRSNFERTLYPHRLRRYSPVHISWNKAFLKILKKPSIVQKKMKAFNLAIDEKQNFFL